MKSAYEFYNQIVLLSIIFLIACVACATLLDEATTSICGELDCHATTIETQSDYDDPIVYGADLTG